ncbi:MAG: helix-turn-helix domain-containing protein [Chthonomonas sp.]|nr:helix-turn-helix domain-containing protein [Chthonomonas sp.]
MVGELVEVFGSQAQLARILDVPPQTISNWLKGVSQTPQRARMQALEALYHLSPEDRLMVLKAQRGFEAEEEELYSRPFFRPSIRKLLSTLRDLQLAAKNGSMSDEEADAITQFVSDRIASG